MKHDLKECLVELMINSLEYDYKEWEHEVNSGMAGTFHSYKSPDFEIENGTAWFFVDYNNVMGVHISHNDGKYSRYVVPRLQRWNPFHTPTNVLSNLVSRMKSYHSEKELSDYEERIQRGLNEIRSQVK